ncbi:2ccff58c-e7e6-4803-914e-635f5505848e [Thermothielavioides terrestris]|uniref:2ccff58c-e7e6-4803-914e-635f5505848e n=1 Tax=Thermothielavioides terrestris TaxID=2587410 RepID=A0A3S4BBF5_9PEZI|nr:2ccff58c-e7e6-4803-914e-635f5505848e [Thermothielavioides terrestris]
MPVTELACLRNAALSIKLRAGVEEQAKYSNAKTSVLSQIEDPSYIYILGKWDSVAQHMEEWVPSQRNQEIMAGLSEDLELAWIRHVDLASDSVDDERIPYSAPVVAIGRYTVAAENIGGFGSTFAETKHHLKGFGGRRDISGGWCADRDGQFILFSGWEAVEEHYSFAQSEGFKEFGRIRDYLEEFEIKHARWEFTLD